tara:strand:+ start:6356 stop:6556 length:201 start_codon:yes stop_codon:yes gene_type:complete
MSSPPEPFAWVTIENYISVLGKKIKRKYIEDFGEEPPTHPHPIKGTNHKMNCHYYPAPWLKRRLEL